MNVRATFVLLLLIPYATATGLYKWVDEKGAVHYSDSLPPVSQPAGVSKLNREGVVIDKAESVTARAAREAAETAARQARQQQREQQRRDQALLERYTSVRDIESERDKQLAVMQSGIALLQQQQKRSASQLAALQAELRRQRGAGKPPGDGLASQIAEQQRQLKNTSEQLLSRQNETARLRQKAAQDSARLHELLQARPAPHP